MKKIIDPNQILDINEVGKLLGISPITIARLKKQGRFPQGGKIGNRTRWLGSDILAACATLSNKQSK